MSNRLSIQLSPADKHAITSIIRAAEMNILLQTGINLRLQHALSKPIKEDVQVLMGVVAEALGLTTDEYFGGRQRECVDLRVLASLFIKELYPDVTLKVIGQHIGGIDHTSVIYSINRGLSYLKTKEDTFCAKYDLVRTAVDQWLRTVTYNDNEENTGNG